MGFLTGKRALVTGVASRRSIAWGVAEAMHRQGASIALTYQNDKLASRAHECAEAVDGTIVLECDVASDTSVDAAFGVLAEQWGGLDIIVHAIAYAPREALEGDYLDATTREAFVQAHDISAYSLIALAKAARKLMAGRNGALVTLSYLGAVRAVTNYNVMGSAKASLEANVRYLARALGAEGTRVNGISAGPVRTLAASGIKDFRAMLDMAKKAAPLQKNVTIEEIGNAAAFLCSDLASGITGEILYVDAGYNVVGDLSSITE